MKKLTSLLLLPVVLLSLCVPSHAAGLDNFEKALTYQDGQFTDVGADSWCAANVRAAYELGIMNGTSATTFDPNGDVTVGQALIMSCRLHNTYYENHETFGPGYDPYVEYAQEQEMDLLADLDELDLNAVITRAGFAAFLNAALPDKALPQISSVEEGSIPEVDLEAAYADAVYRLYRAGILTGNDAKGTFGTFTSITRGAAAAIVSRMADPSLRKAITLVKQPFQPVPIDQLENLTKLRKNTTDEEFAQAYDMALEIVTPYANLSREEQLYGIAVSLRSIVDSGINYSTSEAHYNDPYGFFVLNTASCAGCARATGLCLSILGIPYEHVNENQWSHQW
ncbi:MAG: S-layer homology domain-containing protein, partial [Oscillibacter sp.]|nr:S-layer homology domain-containing protein [Oscillibacter sp.]